MRAADPTLLDALLLLLLLLPLLDAAWTPRPGGGCCCWRRRPPGLDPFLCPREPVGGDIPGCGALGRFPGPSGESPLQDPRGRRGARFATLPGATPPARDKTTPDWDAFFSCIALLVGITLGLVACHCMERYWGRPPAHCCAHCCAHVFESESLEFSLQMEDLPSSLRFPIPSPFAPYMEHLINQDAVAHREEVFFIHLDSVGAANSENPASNEPAVPGGSPAHDLEPGLPPEHVLEPRPPPEDALEPRPFPERAPELISNTQRTSTPGEEKLHE